MAISINWGTSVISVPLAGLTLVSPGLYELDVNQFRLELKDLEDSEAGMVAPITHRHNTTVTLAGVTYARSVEILAPYTVTFEDGSYRVRFVGANHNVGDVTNVNQVSLLIQNSAGLIEVDTGGAAGAVADAVWEHAVGALIRKIHANKIAVDPATGKIRVYEDDNSTVAGEADVYQDVAGATPFDGSGPVLRRDKVA